MVKKNERINVQIKVRYPDVYRTITYLFIYFLLNIISFRNIKITRMHILEEYALEIL